MGYEDIQHTSESALLAAGWRAMESSRPDALFHDPLAASLAGERGLRIARTLPDGAWVVAIRTVLIDAFIGSAISSGIDTVINLGAVMDTRPYRMDLPASLHRVEVDHPSLIESKDAQLSTEVPACSIERIGLDLPTTRPAGKSSMGSGPPPRERWSSRKGCSVPSTWTRPVAWPTIYVIGPAASRG